MLTRFQAKSKCVARVLTRSNMLPFSRLWWATLTIASVVFAVAQIGSFSLMSVVLVLCALVFSPIPSTVDWFGKNVGSDPLVASAAVSATLALPFCAALLAGLANDETNVDPNYRPVSHGVAIVAIAVAGIALSMYVPETNTTALSAAIVIPFVVLGVQAGASFRGGEEVTAVNVLIALSVVFAVLVASIAKHSREMNFAPVDKEGVLQGQSQTSLPLFA